MGRRRVISLVSVLVAIVLAGACTDDGDDAADAATTTTEAPTTAAPPATAEEFTGDVEDFYVVPDPLPAGEPGAVIRTMEVEAPDGQVGLRVMYHSTDAEGDDRAATGLVYSPTAEAPADGWPVLAWGHGTSGLAPQCAPSRAEVPPPAYGVEGVLVQPDYIGLGPADEVHPYLSAAAEGNAVVDLVAAARTLDVGAGDRWAVVGVSQGGHAALVTAERAADRLPDAELVGVVAMAPGAELGATFGDGLQQKVIITMVMVGLVAEDPSLDLADYLSPEGVAASAVVTEGCVGDIIGALPAVAADPGYFTQGDPRETPVGQEWIAENDPGQTAVEPPVLLVQGGQDILVVPARTDALFTRLCGLGDTVERLDVPEADHDTVVPLSEDAVTAWVQARFAGEPAADDC